MSESIGTRGAAARRRSPAAIFLFADAERNVLVLDHVGDLASHGEDKENDPVANQYRPEDGNIKDREERHQKGYAECFGHGVPEFKLRQSADKWLELVRATSRQRSSIRGFELRINERGQEPNEQIQEVDTKTIRDDVESMNGVNPQTVDKKDDKRSNPPVS
uniref:Uncharacterized protein n=1 Tax=Noccaea caerulescens TaxID=107243 RepID=A0A1J3HUD5_NOCCA